MSKNSQTKYFLQSRLGFILTNLIALLACFTLQAHKIQPQQGTITLHMSNASVGKVLDKIESISDYRFVYSVKIVDLERKVSINVKNQSIETVLKIVFKNTTTNFKIRDTQIMLSDQSKKVTEAENAEVQDKKLLDIKGRVLDENLQTLPGALVIVLGTNNEVLTDSDGAFNLQAPRGSTITVNFLGYAPKKVIANKEKMDIQIFPKTEELNEVVVTGIFNRAKESYTGAATFINKKQLDAFSSRDLVKTISNIDPSFNIVQNNINGSDPNRLPEITIRGTSSLPNKSELELSGLQENERANLNTPLFILDGFEISLQRMLDLNQDEIESVTILKDASATAIYGAQGANGVVVLTSIKPKSGKLRVTYTSNYNVEVPDLRSYDLLNSAEKLELERVAGLYTSPDFNQQILLNQTYNKKLSAVVEGVDTYWLSRPVQTGLGQTHNLNLGGGDPAFRYSLSFQFRNIVGAMKGSERENFNGTMNITYLFKNLQFSNQLSIGMNKSEDSMWGSFSEYASLNPYWKPLDENGEIPMQYGIDEPGFTPVFNPMYNASVGGYDKSKYTDIRENFQLEWTATDYLKIKGTVGYSKNMASSDNFLPPDNTAFYNVTDDKLRGSYDFSTRENTTLNAQTTINFAKVFGNHKVFIGINGNIRESQSVNYFFGVTGFAHNRMDFISMGSQYRGDSPGGREGTTRSLGLTSNASYSFNDIIFSDLSYRLDGASSFGENTRFAPFFSVGLGANFSKLEFVKQNASFISNLRPKYSYGTSGSLQFSPYDAMTTYQYLINEDRYDGHLATAIRGIGNPNLKWQTTFQHNIGFEIGLFRNRINFNTNYYHKTTKDLITTVNLPLSNGYTTYTENLGDVLNTGIEADLSYNIIRNNTKGWSWSVTGSVAQNSNKLLRISEAMEAISRANENYNVGRTEPNLLYREGQSMSTLYVVPSLGIDPATGKEMFLDENGNATYTFQTFNRVAYGLTQPKLNGRFSTNAAYKNIRLNLGFSFTTGASVYNSTLANKVETNDFTKNVDQRVYDGRWRQPGDIVPYKSLTSKDPTYMTSRFVQQEKTLSLNSLNLDYRVPQTWTKKYLKMDRLNVTYSTNDLLYFSTIRKERGTGYPFAWRHSLAISLGF